MSKRRGKRTVVSGYARMWPRAVFYSKTLGETGRRRNLARELEFLQLPGVYVLYRDDTPYYIGKADKLRRRLHTWATKPNSRHFHFWNYFSAFAVKDPRMRNELEGVLIASLPTANNGVKPKLKNAGLPREVKELLRKAYSGAVTAGGSKP